VKAIDDPGFEVKWVDKAKPSAPSRLDRAVMGAIEAVTGEMWPGVPVMPLMSTGASDGLYLRNAGIPTYGVSGLFSELADNRAHGRDDRLQFLYALVRRVAS
jgi:acetylornithine deacetylase/succinyl-diaminopimelate desuccinylase-like protein